MTLLDSLVSYWKLDEASGDAVDAHGSNTLTDTNTVTSAAGIIGNGRDFEVGNSEYFTIASNASLQTGDIDFTWAAWVKLESIPATHMGIMSQDGDAQRGPILFHRTTFNRFTFNVRRAGADVICMADNLGAPSAGVWYHVVGWHDAAADQTGIAINAGTPNTTATGGALDAVVTADFRIGSRVLAASPAYMDGIIDEAGFWKRVLTSDERVKLYNGGRGLRYPFNAGQQLINGGLLRSPLVNGGLVA